MDASAVRRIKLETLCVSVAPWMCVWLVAGHHEESLLGSSIAFLTISPALLCSLSVSQIDGRANQAHSQGSSPLLPAPPWLSQH